MIGLIEALEASGRLPEGIATEAFFRELFAGIAAKGRTYQRREAKSKKREAKERQRPLPRRTRRTATAGPGQRQRRLTQRREGAKTKGR